jgi:hypothetical protein
VTPPVVTDRISCRTCGSPMAVIWCTDGSWRGFDPAPVAGRGWWWSKHRGGMVSPASGCSPLHAYRVHRCPEEDLPVGQLELFPASAAVQRPRVRSVRPAPRRAGGIA